MSKIKVLLVTEAFGAGVLSALEAICESINTRADVYLLYSTREETPKDEELKRRFKGDISLIPLKYSKGIIGKFELTYNYFKIIKDIKPDIIHLHSSIAGFFGRIVSKLACSNARLLYSAHCFSFLRTDISKSKRVFFYCVEKILVLFPVHFVAVSNYEAEIASKLGHKNISVVYNTIAMKSNSEKYVLSTADNAKKKILIGTNGRLTTQKNPDLFLKIAEGLHNICSDVTFCWVGGGNELETNRFLTEINRRNLNDAVELTGWISHREAIEKLKQFDVYIHTASWEALPISMIEAMAMKKPIVSTNFPGVKELVSEDSNGYIVDDASEFIERLVSIINDPIKISQMGRESYLIFDDKYDPGKYSDAVRGLYDL